MKNFKLLFLVLASFTLLAFAGCQNQPTDDEENVNVMEEDENENEAVIEENKEDDVVVEEEKDEPVDSAPAPTPEVTPEPAVTPEAKTVNITDGGFSPSSLEIPLGTTVTFVNKTDKSAWPASDVHPSHTLCLGFDSLGTLATGETYSYTFKKAQTCTMHDHLNPSVKGVIVIK